MTHNVRSRDRFNWHPGEHVIGHTRTRAKAEADLASSRQALRVAKEWLAHVEREPRPPAGIVDRQLLAAKLALDDATEKERHAAAGRKENGAAPWLKLYENFWYRLVSR